MSRYQLNPRLTWALDIAAQRPFGSNTKRPTFSFKCVAALCFNISTRMARFGLYYLDKNSIHSTSTYVEKSNALQENELSFCPAFLYPPSTSLHEAHVTWITGVAFLITKIAIRFFRPLSFHHSSWVARHTFWYRAPVARIASQSIVLTTVECCHHAATFADVASFPVQLTRSFGTEVG